MNSHSKGAYIFLTFDFEAYERKAFGQTYSQHIIIDTECEVVSSVIHNSNVAVQELPIEEVTPEQFLNYIK